MLDDTRRWGFGLIALLVTTPGAPGQDFEQCKSSARAAAAKLETAAPTIQTRVETKMFDLDAGEQLMGHQKEEYKRRPDARLDRYEFLDVAYTGKHRSRPREPFADLSNPAYRCRVTQAGEAGSWVLSGELTPAAEAQKPWPAAVAGAGHGLFPHMSVGAMSLADLFAHPTFVLEKYSPSTATPGCHTVRFRAGLSPDEPGQVTTGELDLDSALDWSVRRSELVTGAGAARTEGRSEVTVTMHAAGIPLPTRNVSVVRQTRGGAPFNMRLENTYTCDVGTLPDAADFTLTAFGLPEPVGVTWEKPTPRYVWLLAAAGACAVVALGLGWLARRRRAEAGADTAEVTP